MKSMKFLCEKTQLSTLLINFGEMLTNSTASRDTQIRWKSEISKKKKTKVKNMCFVCES